ncbi:unnamed protein product [Brassicogethes aeneus]|uniref:Lipid scramblase CLPTM1L n=1 Tax=Brassicogethes aeneus TaxID=1431903 RepID=A0A9P0ASP6_BRAAE|nr:unnamed protein product [Brassicogethes aeneus]
MRAVYGYLLTTLFFAFILKSIYSLISIYQAPTCNSDEVCYNSILNKNPNLDLFVFISDNSRSGNYDLVFSENKFDFRKNFEREISIELSKTSRNNGSIFLHSVILPSKKRTKPSLHELANEKESTYVRSYLTRYAIPASATFNLLRESGKNEVIKPVSHLRSRYYILMLTEELNLPHTNIPPEFLNFFRVSSKREFLPIVQEDSLQMRLKDLEEITMSTREAKFLYSYNPASLGKMRFLLQIKATLVQFMTLGFTEKDVDEVKGVFADTNLYLLCATVFIGSVHLLLDFLSFKSDVSFWKSQTSMAGLSSRTVLWRAFSQTIIFSYLLDEGTSLLVLIPSGIATLIEFWKVSKVLKTTVSWNGGFSFSKETNESEEEKMTRKYDEECMKYLSYLLYPLCLAAAVYSLIYQPHKSWYSWTINSLVNGVYAFGFLFMLPQLFINYRLKSVAALPWRAFTYRAFNTFIDDIFAFIITMPTAHRLACFRDDIIFLVYLYQRWLYPVDKTRTDDPRATETAEESKKKK